MAPLRNILDTSIVQSFAFQHIFSFGTLALRHISYFSSIQVISIAQGSDSHLIFIPLWYPFFSLVIHTIIPASLVSVLRSVDLGTRRERASGSLMILI
jgi:hypothetical protein